MRTWHKIAMETVVCVVLAACIGGGRGQVTAARVADAEHGKLLTQQQGPHKLACAHCHADRQAYAAGRISPGPPWPGIARRTTLRGKSIPLEDAVASCAVDHLGQPLDKTGVEDVVAFLRAQGDVMLGQPDAYDVTLRTRDEVAALDVMNADSWRGEKLFPRACGACHGAEGPSYGLDSLQAHAPVEILQKVLLAPQEGDHMPPFARGTLTDQEALDLAAWLGGQG